MPIYEYKCDLCKAVREELIIPGKTFLGKVSCPVCGGDMEKIISPVAVRSGIERIDDSDVVEQKGNGADLSGFETIHDKPVGEVKRVPKGEARK